MSDFLFNIIRDFDTMANWTVGVGSGSVAFTTGKITFTGAAGQSKIITYNSPAMKMDKNYAVYILFKEITGVDAGKKITIDIDSGTDNAENYINGMRFFRMSSASSPIFKIIFSNSSNNSSQIEITEIQMRELEDDSYFLREDFFDTYYTLFDKQTDSFKDQAGQGIFERFQLLKADEIDQQIVPVFENMVSKLVPANLCRFVYIPLWEEQYGVALFYDEALRRKLINQVISINKIKGSIKSFEILFAYINSTIVITEEWEFSSFDSPTTLDSPTRRFDMSQCRRYCTNFDLDITYAGTVDAAYLAQIMNIINYLKPINADYE